MSYPQNSDSQIHSLTVSIRAPCVPFIFFFFFFHYSRPFFSTCIFFTISFFLKEIYYRITVFFFCYYYSLATRFYPHRVDTHTKREVYIFTFFFIRYGADPISFGTHPLRNYPLFTSTRHFLRSHLRCSFSLFYILI